MAYSQFILDQVKTDFDLTIQENQPLFTDLVELNPSPLLQQILQEYWPLTLAINSETDRSEFIIAPILGDVRHQATRLISLFSGKEFNVVLSRRSILWPRQ